MVAPILWGIMALGAFALSCSREEEPPPPESKPTPPPAPPCPGDSYSLDFGPEHAVLCHRDGAKDGVFQVSQDQLHVAVAGTKYFAGDRSAFEKFRRKFGLPDFEGLHLSRWKENHDWVFPSSGAWSSEAEALLSNAVEFCRERGLEFSDVRRLAAKILPSSQPALVCKEKAYALMVAAILLSIRKETGNSFYTSQRAFIDTTIEKIEAGKLRLRDAGRDGQKGDLFTRAYYLLNENTLAVSETSLDLRKVQDRATIVHELFHFFQDARREKISLADTEFEAYFVEAEYALQEKGFLDGKTGPETIESYITEEITQGKPSSHPVPVATRAVYFRARGDRTAYGKWREKCREDTEVTKTLDGFMRIMTGPGGPGQPGSVLKNFLEKNPQLDELSPKDSAPIWEAEIQKLETVKNQERDRLRNLLSGPSPAQGVLLKQYFKTLKTGLDAVLLKRIRQLRARQREGGQMTGSPVDPSDQSYLTTAARELSPLRVNRILLSPIDGVE